MDRWKKYFIGLGMGFLLTVACMRQSVLVLINSGQSVYSIRLASDAGEMEQRAARLLQSTVEEMTQVCLPIENADTAAGDSVFVIRVDASMSPDAFTLKRQGPVILISGGPGRGVFIGTARLLEHWGCDILAPGVAYIPRSAVLSIGKLNVKEMPAFAYREILMPNARDSTYADWHGIHNQEDRNRTWGLYVHTFDDLVPPDTFFKAHPEYFTSLNGLRIPDAQLCLSNEDVYQIVVADLKKRMAENPEAQFWSVSQNDTYSPCGCPECRALDTRYGGPSGTLIYFVNRVAKNFPDKTISTLAYQYTRKAPLHIVPEPNVNIMLCTIECDRSRPLSEEAGEGAFVRDLRDWARLTSNIYLWDYVVQFRSYFNPFPNLAVLQPNLQLFHDHKLAMMFQQGSGNSPSEFHHLRTYLIAKLLWNPEADVAALTDGFLQRYYGAAAPHVKEYINTLHDNLAVSMGQLGIYGTPWDGIDTYLSPEKLPVYAAQLNAAAKAVAADTVLSKRVRFARLPLEYAILEIAKKAPTESLRWFWKEGQRLGINQSIARKFRQFVDEAKAQNIERLHERGLSPYDYESEILKYIRRSMESHLAIDKPVTLKAGPSPKYPAGGAAGLTDALRGPDDYHCNWVGFEGEPFEAVIDLGEIQTFWRVSVDFLQDEMAWIFLPDMLEVEVSADSMIWVPAGKVYRQSPENRPGVFIEAFDCQFDEMPGRYVRVKAHRSLVCPPWHKGAGEKAWAFCDEIVVR